MGNFHLILKIRKNTHIQDVIGHFSIQSRNEPKCDVVVLWTGLHLTKVSYDEINKLSVEDIVNKYQKYLNNPRVIKEIERKSGVII